MTCLTTNTCTITPAGQMGLKIYAKNAEISTLVNSKAFVFVCVNMRYFYQMSIINLTWVQISLYSQIPIIYIQYRYNHYQGHKQYLLNTPTHKHSGPTVHQWNWQTTKNSATVQGHWGKKLQLTSTQWQLVIQFVGGVQSGMGGQGILPPKCLI